MANVVYKKRGDIVEFIIKPTRFIKGPLPKQINKIANELNELHRAFAEETIERVAEELADVMVAATTMVAMLEKRGVNFTEVLAAVEVKNAARDYY